MFQHVSQNTSIKLCSKQFEIKNNKSDLILGEAGLSRIDIRIILLSVSLVSRSQSFNFIHSRVEVLDVLWGVQTSRVVVLVGYYFGAKGKSTPVVARANVFHFLSTQRRNWSWVLVKANGDEWRILSDKTFNGSGVLYNFLYKHVQTCSWRHNTCKA